MRSMHNYKARRPWFFRSVVIFLAMLGALLLVVSTTSVASWWATRLAGPWDDPKGDVLIVLGGSLLDPGLMGPNSYWRAIYALQAWREGGFHDIVITGGGDPETAVATVMKDFLTCHGVPESAVHVETRSNSTYENARFSKPILDQLP